MVIDRAMEVFWTHGYANTSPAQLAAATGVAKGSLYNAFNSKRELFDRALVRYGEQVGGLVQEMLSGPGTARECIGAALRYIVDSDLAQPVRRGCLVANTAAEMAGHDPQLAAKIHTMQEQTVEAFAARIELGKRDGDVDAALDARAVGHSLATTLAGLRVMAMTYDAPTLHRTIDAALAAL